MNLAIFLNIKFYYDGKVYTADERYFEFWTSFTEYYRKVILCVPVLITNKKKGVFKIDLKQNKIEIYHFPYYKDSIELYKKSFFIMSRLKKIISNNISKWDIIGAVVPNIVGLFVLNQAKLCSKPCFAYIRGNHKKTIKYEFRGIKKLVAYLIASLLELITKHTINSIPTFVVGKELYNKFSNV